MVVSVVLAIVIVLLTYKFTYNLAVPVIAALAGAFGFYMIFQVSGLATKIKTGQVWVQLGFSILGGLVGIFIGIKVQFVVKTVGSAFIGAFMCCIGASFYLGHLITKEGQE